MAEILDEIKGGGFLVRDLDIEELYIPEQFDEDHKMIRDSVREFIKQIDERSNQLELQRDLMEEAAEVGLLGAHIPEQYGGSMMDTITNTIISEEISRSSGSFNTTFAAHTGIGMLPILFFGTEEQKKNYLPSLANGEKIAAYCLTEPGSGSDALAAKTRADLTEDGQNYILNGQKMWISNAGFADLLIVFAKINGDQFTGFIVDAASPGVTLGEEEKKMGIKGSSTRQVFFENAKVPVENVLGEIGKGHLIAFNALNIGRFKLGNMCIGGCKEAIAASVEYANQRHQFGKPISSFGAVRKKLAEQSILCFALESAVYRTAGHLAEKKTTLAQTGNSSGQAYLEAAKEYAIECAIIKVAGSEYLDMVVDEMVQIYGGYGFSEEYPAAEAYRDSRINRIYEGTNEINRMLIVRTLLKKAMKGDINMTDAAWAVQKELTQMPSMADGSGVFALEKNTIKNLKKGVLMVVGAAVKKQMDGQLNLEKDQEILLYSADLLIDVYLAESVVMRIAKMEDYKSPAPPEVYSAIMKVFLNNSTQRLKANADNCLASFAGGDLLNTLLMGSRRFFSYQPVNVMKEREVVASWLTKEGKV